MAEKPKQKKRRKWSLTETVTKIADSEGFDLEEFGADLTISGLLVEVYGQARTDPDEAERLIRRRIREERGKMNRKNEHPTIPIDQIIKEDSGVLDMLINRAEEKLPTIRKKIAEKVRMLENPELEAYERGRLERDLSVLREREQNNVEMKEQCEKRRNEIWAPEGSKSNEQPDPPTGDSTKGDSPEA